MRCPFEWVVGDSSKGHTVTAPTFSAGPRPPAATPLYGALLGRGMLDLDALQARPTGAVIEHRRSALLWQVLTHAYEHLGLDAAAEGDEAFMQMVLGACQVFCVSGWVRGRG